jgi:hypothetical protein
MQQKAVALTARAVALEMLMLAGHALWLGVAVSVLIAIPVTLLSALAA